jgi:hypothetical protein
LRISLLVINHVYDLSNDAGSIQEQVNDLEPLVKQDNEIDTLKVFIPVLPSLKKKGRLKGSRNQIINSISLEN